MEKALGDASRRDDDHAAELLEERLDEFAELESENIGMPLAGTRAMAKRAAGTFRYFGGYADKLSGAVMLVAPDFHTYTRREPHGVVVAIVPGMRPSSSRPRRSRPRLHSGTSS